MEFLARNSRFSTSDTVNSGGGIRRSLINSSDESGEDLPKALNVRAFLPLPKLDVKRRLDGA